MAECTLIIKDFVNCVFKGLDPLTRKHFSNALKFSNPTARFSPKFKLGRWDGKVAFGTLGGATQINLLDRVIPLIMEAGYEIEIEDHRPDLNIVFPVIEDDELAEFCWPATHRLAGEPIMLMDHQVTAINTYFTNQQSIQSISVGAGKTIICAAISRKVEQITGGRTLVIVPSKTLVLQTEEDYLNIQLDVGVYYGDRKDVPDPTVLKKIKNKKHLICTWQSLVKLAKMSKEPNAKYTITELLEDVTCVIVDECHTIKGAELRDLLCNHMSFVPLRWGMTGTIPKEEYQFICLVSAIGEIVGEIKTVELQELGLLAGCHISIVQLNDDHVEYPDYESEHAFLLKDKNRLRWIAEWCDEISKTGNTIIFVDRIETGEMLESLIPDSVFVSGKDSVKTRKAEYDGIQSGTNKKVIATYGVASTGINIPRIFNLIALESGKSYERIFQTFGRSLRLAIDKVSANIFDVCSNMKFSKRHLAKRKAMYREAGFKFTMDKVNYR